MKKPERINLKCKKCKMPYTEHTCYWQPCEGCWGGHSSFHRTVIKSSYWKMWEKEQKKRMLEKEYDKCFDIAECSECGYISKKHFNAFITFLTNKL